MHDAQLHALTRGSTFSILHLLGSLIQGCPPADFLSCNGHASDRRRGAGDLPWL